MKKNIWLIVICIFVLTLSGCKSAGDKAVKDTRPTVVVQSLSSTEDMQRAVEEQCPDINIKWYLSSQVHENAYHGMTDTPDILIRQTYYLDEQSSEYLRDISAHEITENFSRYVIDSFRDAEGALYWLPTQGTGYILVANPDLFEKYGVALPTDYESLVAANAAFKEQGIDGVAWGISPDWGFSAMMMAEILGADLINSVDGMAWRNAYVKQAEGYTLDDSVWPEIFRRWQQAMESGLFDEKDMTDSQVNAIDSYRNGESAMALIASSSLSGLEGNVSLTVLPVFDTTGTPWLPLYMNLRVGVSANVTDERMESVMKVLEAMISTKTYNAFNESRGGVIPMNNDGDALPEIMAGFKQVVDDGYSFLLFNDNNSGLIEGVSEAFHTMFAEKLSAEEAYALCGERILANRKTQEAAGLNDGDESAVFYVSENEYPLITDETHNSPANSVMVNTMLKAYNTYSEEPYDILIMEGNTAGAPIRKGKYYKDAAGEVNSFSSNFYYLFNSARAVYPATMTVEELIRYINTSFYSFHRIDDGLAVMAGASYKVEKHPEGIPDDKLPFTPNNANLGMVANRQNYPTCYVCTGIIKDGKELPLDQELRVLIGRVEIFYMTESDKSLPSTWVGFDESILIPNEEGKNIDYRHLVARYLEEGNKLEAPTKYVEITTVK